MMNYYITFDSSGGLSLAHGVEWRKHKYIRKEGNRYIYPEDLKKSVGKTANSMQAKAAAVQAQAQGMKRTNYYNSEGKIHLTGRSDYMPAVSPGAYGRKALGEYLDAFSKQRAANNSSNQDSNASTNVNKYQQDGQKRTAKQNAQNAASKYQNDGYRRTAMERDRQNREQEKRRVDAEWAAYAAQRRGERQTKLEDHRALERGAAQGKKLMEIRQRGEQQTRDFYERENIHGPRYYNVSKDTPGAIKTSHGSFGTTEYFKLESPKEHQDRLNAGVAQRAAGVKFKASINTATKAVAKWGSNTINSAKNLASKGASLVSNLFKKKK